MTKVTMPHDEDVVSCGNCGHEADAEGVRELLTITDDVLYFACPKCAEQHEPTVTTDEPPSPADLFAMRCDAAYDEGR